MVRSQKSNGGIPGRLLLQSLLAAMLSFVASAQNPAANARGLEGDIARALVSRTGCKNVTVQVSMKGNTSVIARLALKLESVPIGQLVADFMTVVYENPAIDLRKLRKDNELAFTSPGKPRVGIFASAASLEKYLQKKAEQFNKKNVRIRLKFTPPYVECTYDVPKSEIASESVDLLKKFISGDKIEGYAAFQMDAKSNGLYASSSKVITNHFLLPNGLLRMFESKFNPFDEIAVVQPFEYTINSLTVQPKYIYMSN